MSKKQNHFKFKDGKPVGAVIYARNNMGKRFKQVYPDIIGSNYDFTDNGKGISHREVVDLLNGLSEKQRITNMTNQALIRFIKSKGYSLEEVLGFVKEL